MNKKQLVVLWAVVVLLSIGIAAKGIEENDILLAIAGPTLLLGGMLIYQFRDKSATPREPNTKHLLWALAGLLLLQPFSTWANGRELKHLNATVEEMQERVDGLHSDLSNIESETSDIKSNTAEIASNSER